MNDEMVEAKCQEFLDKLKQLRIKKGLTQQQIADLTGLKQPNVNRIETGAYKPNLETLMRLIIALDSELNPY